MSDYTISEAALYDLLATAVHMTCANMMDGWMPPADRTDTVDMLRGHLFPPFAVRAALRYAEAGRPQGAEQVKFMEADLALATAEGHEGYVLMLADDLATLKAELALRGDA